jgi:hypothetical protein
MCSSFIDKLVAAADKKVHLSPDPRGSAIEAMVCYAKGVAMEDRSQLAERIIN